MSVVDDSAPAQAPDPHHAAATPVGDPNAGGRAPVGGHEASSADASPPAVAVLRAATVASGGRTLLPPVDLELAAGETVAIVGRSGVGKTTLLHVLAGLVTPTAGTAAAEPAALMPQRDGLMPWATARDNAALPLRIAGRSRAEARAAADAQLEAVGLRAEAGRRVARLSGGQRQRVALARTLLTGRSLLLLDEPFAAVDALTRDELHELLLEHLGAEGRAAVLVTHDVDEAVRLGHRVLVLTGRGGASPPGEPSRSNESPQSAEPTRWSALVAPSVPLVGAPGERLAQRGGEPLRAAIRAELGR